MQRHARPRGTRRPAAHGADRRSSPTCRTRCRAVSRRSWARWCCRLGSSWRSWRSHDDGQRYRIGSITGRRAYPSPSFDPQLQALMLTSVGRTGTVLMMRMLAAHPSIVVHPAGRYEVWPARYWAHMLAVLSVRPTTASRRRRSASITTSGTSARTRSRRRARATATSASGSGAAYVDRLASFCLRNVEDWYAIALATRARSRCTSRRRTCCARRSRPWCVGPVSRCARGVPRPRLPRRGLLDALVLGRHVALRRLRHGPRRARAGRSPHAAPRRRLARAGSAGASRPLRGSGVAGHGRHSPACSASSASTRPRRRRRGAADRCRRARFTGHGTSTTVEQSVGRWAREGDESFRATLNEVLHEGLVEFGYAEAAAERI